MGPDGIIAGTIGDDGVGRQRCPQIGHHFAHLKIAGIGARIAAPGAEGGVGSLPGIGPGHPLGRCQPLQRGGEADRCCDNTERGSVNPANLLRPRMNMDQALRRPRNRPQLVALAWDLGQDARPPPAAGRPGQAGPADRDWRRCQDRRRNWGDRRETASGVGIRPQPADRTVRRSRSSVIRASSLHREPPRSTIGAVASCSLRSSSVILSAAGSISTGENGGASTTSAVSTNMSSGSAITTGPGRPEVATKNAREMISGMRAASSISTAHLASPPPNTWR